MPANVKTIPAKIDPRTRERLSSVKKRRVAAYARVSTELEEQQNSYEAQIEYYSNFIKSRADWEFVDVYADEGITGTSMKKRESFQRMVQDALEGKIDLILTKSVSRFARNTVDSLSTIRLLKDNGVEVMFEKENIQTFDAKGELLITIMSSLAQEESRSISENVKWGIAKKFSDGKYSLPYATFLGYDKGPDGKPIINPEQAELVKRIFKLFLDGNSFMRIAEIFNDENIPTIGKGKQWYPATIKSILTNEKYKGDALLQKTFSTDFLSKRYKRNTGELPQYYVENDHEAIIAPKIFDLVQELIRERQEKGLSNKTVRIFSGRIYCGKCGTMFGSKTWHSNSKYKKIVWQCNHKYKGEGCSCPYLEEEEIKNSFVRAANALLEDKKGKCQHLTKLINEMFDVTDLMKQKEDLEQQMAVKADDINDHLLLNTTVAQDQIRFQEKYDRLSEEYIVLEKKHDEVISEIAKKKSRQTEIAIFMDSLNQNDLITEFDSRAWYSLVRKVTVFGKDDLVFLFKDGTEIRVS